MKSKTDIKCKDNFYRSATLLAMPFALALFVIVMPLAVRAAASSTLSFNPSSPSVAAGDDFTLDAVIDPGTAPNTNSISAVELHITFDPAKLRLDSITSPSAPANCTATPTFSTVLQTATMSNVNGTASIISGVCMASPAAPVVTPATVATFHFHALASTNSASSSVTFYSSTQAAAIGESGNVITGSTPAAVTISSASGGTNPPTLTEITPVPSITNDSTPNYTFVSNQDGDITYGGSCAGSTPDTVVASSNKTVTFNTLADGTYSNCTVTVTNLGGGYYTLNVTPFTVDATPPNTNITAQPASPTSSTSANFAFTSTESNSTFECKMDNGAFASCTTPKSYTSLAEGPHIFQVRATDAAGNTDATPASYTWAIDTTAPDTTINTNPTDPSNSATADFTFTSDDLNATFECKMDNGSFASCATPKSYTSMTDGSHTFYVRAKDQATNVDATPASYTWTVDAGVPVITPVSPSGSAPLPLGTTQTIVAISTDVNANCKYDTKSGTAYASMPNTFDTTGAKAHSFVATGLTDGSNRGYFVRCLGPNGNSDAVDSVIAFSVASPVVVPPVVIAPATDNSNNDSSNSSHHDDKNTNPTRKITNSRIKVARGMTITQRGNKFSKNSIVLLYFTKYGGAYYPPVKIKTTSRGSFVISYRVNKQKGTYYWYAVDTKTGRKSKILYYRVKN